MTKRNRQLKPNTRARKDSMSPDQPRTQSPPKLLRRFYEPLVLLHTLGSTRGERPDIVLPHRNDIAHLPLQELRRMFLTELAYVCDYDKGGQTVTAICLQSTPERHIFWIASNKGPRPKVTGFLHSLLLGLMQTAASDPTRSAAELAKQCIQFATPRIKKYRSLLKPLLTRCISHLVNGETKELDLVEWLRCWDSIDSPFDLCHFAYGSRKSNPMRALARLSEEPNHKSNKDAIHKAFGLIKHYVGRLGHHFRAAEVLLLCVSRLMPLLDNFEVCAAPVPAMSDIPPATSSTTPERVVNRMLQSGTDDLEYYQQALVHMDLKYQLFSRFLENFSRSDPSPCIHAEIQLLEHCYSHNMAFAGDDPFIACSKPACFHCLLYFRHHPGRFEVPESHYKSYLTWRLPKPSKESDTVKKNHQRDIVNAMAQDLRKEALHQIDKRLAPRDWHPDSLTGITRSIQPESDGERVELMASSLEVAKDGRSTKDTGFPSHSSKPATSYLTQVSMIEFVQEQVLHASSNLCSETAEPEVSADEPEDFAWDSSEDGGILL